VFNLTEYYVYGISSPEVHECSRRRIYYLYNVVKHTCIFMNNFFIINTKIGWYERYDMNELLFSNVSESRFFLRDLVLYCRKNTRSSFLCPSLYIILFYCAYRHKKEFCRAFDSICVSHALLSNICKLTFIFLYITDRLESPLIRSLVLTKYK
jgi:hypothetical protein